MKTEHHSLRTALAHMKSADPLLAKAMKRLAPMPSFPMPGSADSHFHSLSRTILYQQLAGNAAKTIHDRVRRLGNHGRFPTPKAFLSLSSESIRSCGVSGPKQASLRDLADNIDSGALSLRTLTHMDDDQIIQKLTLVRGIGLWTAQMFLIFRMGRQDVLPTGDLGVQEGARILDGLHNRPSPAELAERGMCWKPYRSLATWTLYRIVDEHRQEPE